MASSRPFVTIVSGVPRSGTSLMMSMLVAGGLEPVQDGVRAADEDNPRGYYELEAVKRLRDDASWVAGAAGKVVKVVHVHVKDLPRAGVEYRVVLMKRDLGEVLKSQRKMLERRGKPGGSLSDERAAQLFARQVEDLERLLASEPAFRWMPVSYNDLVRDPVPLAAAVNRFLGGGLDEEAMRKQVDPGLYRSGR
jgi:hypothetical protein